MFGELDCLMGLGVCELDRLIETEWIDGSGCLVS